VAEQAQRVVHTLAEDERPLLIAAAWLHDIGKNPLIAATGWHPIDGARALQGLVPDRLTALIAHHSGARYEADRRGMAELLGEFPRERSPLANALTYADLTVGVDGAPITVTERLADIGYRHGSQSILAAAIADATDKLVEQATDVERRLADHRVQQGPDNPEPARPSDSPIPLEAAVTATELVSALRRNGLSTLDIGRAVGVRHNTVSRWNNGTRTPSGSCCRRLGELRDVVVLVGGLPPLVITQWLRLPEPTLSGRSPLDAIAAGKKDRVATAASRIVAARRAAASTPSKEET
jgi:DNA-binding transcriptional regulator YiaG